MSLSSTICIVTSKFLFHRRKKVWNISGGGGGGGKV